MSLRAINCRLFEFSGQAVPPPGPRCKTRCRRRVTPRPALGVSDPARCGRDTETPRFSHGNVPITQLRVTVSIIVRNGYRKRRFADFITNSEPVRQESDMPSTLHKIVYWGALGSGRYNITKTNLDWWPRSLRAYTMDEVVALRPSRATVNGTVKSPKTAGCLTGEKDETLTKMKCGKRFDIVNFAWHSSQTLNVQCNEFAVLSGGGRTK